MDWAWDVAGAAGLVIAVLALLAAVVKNSEADMIFPEVNALWNERNHAAWEARQLKEDLRKAHDRILDLELEVHQLDPGWEPPAWIRTPTSERREVRNVDTADTLGDEEGPWEYR